MSVAVTSQQGSILFYLCKNDTSDNSFVHLQYTVWLLKLDTSAKSNP